MVGAVVLTLTLLPAVLGDEVAAPFWVVASASLAQTGVLLALATWAGVRLAPSVGLRAPVFEAWAAGRSARAAVQALGRPAVLWGLVSGALLYAAYALAPPEVIALQERFSPPLVARVLYGGIAEEVLLRWGAMTFLLWAGWRVVQRRGGAPRAGLVWAAIVVSALLFGLSHLPAAAALIGAMPPGLALYVVLANAAFGVLFGYLFWTRGLEASMVAHSLGHVTAALLTALGSV
jgi:membrane protease YdiL (CAAX protease family)